MEKLNVALVGYLNTLPFEYGLKQLSAELPLKLLLDTPAKCAAYFDQGQVDLALVPVGALGDLRDYEVCLDYCIGCDGPVRTVVLFANDPIAEINKIYLDMHSRTSRLLVKLLSEEYIGIKPIYSDLDIEENQVLVSGEAALMIGDKVFANEKHYNYTYDLGHLWKDWTGLPFVFAVWIKRNNLDIDENLINDYLKNGMAKIPSLIDLYAQTTQLPHDQITSYINDNLNYKFGYTQRLAMDRFFQLIRQPKNA